MYCKYAYPAGVTQANILADIAALITGQATSLAQLVACDVANSELITTEAPGWFMHDNWTATRKIFRQPPVDAADGYSVDAVMDLDVGTNGALIMRLHESWNPTTHVGVNTAAASGVTSYCPRLNVSTGGILFIAANQALCGFYSNTGGSWGSSSGGGGATIFAQRTRALGERPVDGLSPMVHFNGQTGGSTTTSAPRVWAPNTQTFVTGTGAQMVLTGALGVTGETLGGGTQYGAYIGPDGQKRVLLSKSRIQTIINPNVGTIREARFSGSVGLTNMDTATENGRPYELWMAAASPLGGGVWVPRQ